MNRQKQDTKEAREEAPLPPTTEAVDDAAMDTTGEHPNGPGFSGPPAAGDARHDAQKQQQNREHLGVNEEHKTPDMEKGHRGTFP